jgi:hypothetical protein
MARIRTIKPEFPQSESMGHVSRDARLLFMQLWTICDDHGRARAAPRMLASLLYPYDDDAPGLIDGWLAELERERCIVRYEAEGARYLLVANWHRHQRIDRPSASKFPPPPECVETPREPSALDQGREGTKDGEGTRARPLIATSLPADWQPSDEDRAWARTARPDLGASMIDSQTALFRLHQAAKNHSSHNWPASWRSWILKSANAEVLAKQGPAPASATVGSGGDGTWRSRLKGYRPGVTRFWPGEWGPRPETGQCHAPAHVLDEWRAALPAQGAA